MMGSLTIGHHFDRAFFVWLADSLAIGVAISLPWSTSATGICIAARLVVLLPSLDPAGFPLAVLATNETGAIAVRPSEWIAPTEDESILLKQKDHPWPSYLMSAARFTEHDGLQLYKPWRGDGTR
jgi:hypothetical protein